MHREPRRERRVESSVRLGDPVGDLATGKPSPGTALDDERREHERAASSPPAARARRRRPGRPARFARAHELVVLGVGSPAMTRTSTSARAAPPVAADDNGARRGAGRELLRELLGEDAADDERPDARRRDLLAQRRAELCSSPTSAATPAAFTRRLRPSSPRAWMLWRTPISTRFATIDEPPTVTNGSGMPVTGAMPIVMPTLTKTWKRKRDHEPARDDDAVEIAGAR